MRDWTTNGSLRRLWDYTCVGAVRTVFRRFYDWAMRSRLAPMNRLARMRLAQLENICSTPPIPNAVTYSLNAKVNMIKCSYRDRDAFQVVIYFQGSALDLEHRCS